MPKFKNPTPSIKKKRKEEEKSVHVYLGAVSISTFHHAVHNEQCECESKSYMTHLLYGPKSSMIQAACGQDIQTSVREMFPLISALYHSHLDIWVMKDTFQLNSYCPWQKSHYLLQVPKTLLLEPLSGWWRNTHPTPNTYLQLTNLERVQQ